MSSEFLIKATDVPIRQELFSPRGLGGIEIAVPSATNLNYHFERGEVEIEPDTELQANCPEEVMNFLKSGNPADLKEYTLGRQIMPEYTRNIVLSGPDDQDIVISGFGLGEIDYSNPSKPVLTYRPPDTTRNLAIYCSDNGFLSVQSSVITPKTGQVHVTDSTEPSGGYSAEEAESKADQTRAIATKVASIPGLADLLVTPTMLGTFRMQTSDTSQTSGLIYARPKILYPHEIEELQTVKGVEDVYYDFLRKEYKVINTLIANDIGHIQLHGSNKGMTADGRIYIGDWVKRNTDLAVFDDEKIRDKISCYWKNNGLDCTARMIVEAKMYLKAIETDLAPFLDYPKKISHLTLYPEEIGKASKPQFSFAKFVDAIGSGLPGPEYRREHFFKRRIKRLHPHVYGLYNTDFNSNGVNFRKDFSNEFVKVAASTLALALIEANRGNFEV